MFPLSINSRQLRTDANTPFLVNGEAAWSALVQLTQAQWTSYLADRVSRGVNTLLINLIEHYFSSQTPAMQNQYSESPFSDATDFSTYNDAYFTRAYNFISEANAAGILCIVCPCYLGYNGGTQGWWTEIDGQTTGAMQSYGEYLGNKFEALPNIIWSLGGDWDGTAEALARQNSIAVGLQNTGRADWIYTYHASPGSDSYDIANGYSWLSLNATYNQTATAICDELQLSYSRATVRPVILFEARYDNEGSPLVTRLQLRNQVYWSILTGGVGHIYGNNPIWHFDTPTSKTPYTYTGTWTDYLASNAMADRQICFNYFNSIPWYDLVPDTGNVVMTAGHGTGESEAVCAANASKSLVVIYTPTQKALTFDGSQMGKLIYSRFINPATNEVTTWRKFAPAATRSITPPASGDWIVELRTQ